MTLFDALRQQWQRWMRSPTWGRSLIGALVLLLAAGYFGVLFVALGGFFPDIVTEVMPNREPLRLLNGFLLYGAVGLVPARFFLQRSAGSDIKPYLSLPLQRPQVVRILQVLSALSLFNLLPLLILAVLWGSTVLPATSAVGATFWAVGALLLVATTQFLNSLLRAAWDRHAVWILGGAGLLAVLVVGSNWTGGGTLRAASTWVFEGLAAGQMLPLVFLFAGTGTLAVAAHRMLWRRLYSVLGDMEFSRTQSTGGLRGAGRGWGRIASLSLLDLKLILRNKRPRQVLLGVILVIGFFAYVFLRGKSDPFYTFLFTFLVSGALALPHSRFSYAWHGDHFDALLMCTPTYLLVSAQYLTFAGLCAISTAGATILLVVLSPSLLVPLFSFSLYHVGVTAPIQLGMGVWTQEAIRLRETTVFNYQGTSTLDFVGIFLAMGFPLILFLWVGQAAAQTAIAGTGAVGLITAPLWMRGLGRLLWSRRHTMVAGFQRSSGRN